METCRDFDQVRLDAIPEEERTNVPWGEGRFYATRERVHARSNATHEDEC